MSYKKWLEIKAETFSGQNECEDAATEIIAELDKKLKAMGNLAGELCTTLVNMGETDYGCDKCDQIDRILKD